MVKMIKKFEDIINEFKELGYSYDYLPNSHVFHLSKSIDEDGYCIKFIHIHYREKYIHFDGGFVLEDLILIKKLIEKLEEK